MIEYLTIPDNCWVKKIIPVRKIYGSDINAPVKEIVWEAIFRENTSNMPPSITEGERYQELQIISLELTSLENIFQTVDGIYAAIKYPCLLVIRFESKYILSVCSFVPGKNDYDSNVNRKIRFSHWLYKDTLSTPAKRFIGEINSMLLSNNSVGEVYSGIIKAFQWFYLSGTSKAHVKRLVVNLQGKTKERDFEKILEASTPYKYYATRDSGPYARYDLSNRNCNYTFVYDYEEIWHCFCRDEKLNRIIQNRRYRDIEDLIYSIDTSIYDEDSARYKYTLNDED